MNIRMMKLAAALRLKGWKLEKPIPLAEVEAAERQYGFTLPEDYKAFITQVGNGGRLRPFRVGPALEYAAREFPLSESWAWDLDPDFLPDDPADQAKWEQVHRDGSVVLLKDGERGQTWFLIVTGPRRGEVWERDEGGTMRLPGCGFLDWLELCLAKKLTAYADSLFRQEREQALAAEPMEAIRRWIGGKRRRDIRWNKPASPEAVRDFERRHGVTLPAAYVRFITEIADGCENFPSANSHGTGGIFYSLAQLDCLPHLDKPFYFTECGEETRRRLTAVFGPEAYNGKHPIWTSLFAQLPREDPVCPVWSCDHYSVLHGVLPFADCRDANPRLNRPAGSQPLLIVTGPLAGQVWRADCCRLTPGYPDFLQWMRVMLELGNV